MSNRRKPKSQSSSSMDGTNDDDDDEVGMSKMNSGPKLSMANCCHASSLELAKQSAMDTVSFLCVEVLLRLQIVDKN